MRGTPEDQRSHPLHRFSGRLHQVLDALGDPAVWSLNDAELAETVTELVGALPRLQAQLLALLVHAETTDLAARSGAVSTAAWLRGQTRVTGPEATRTVKHALALETHEATRAELGAGRIQLAQAVEVIQAVEALPDEVSETREVAEKHLLVEAQSHDAKALRVLGRHLLEVVAPDRADDLIARALEREEAEAQRTSYLRTWDDGHGSLCGRFKIPHLHGAMLTKALAALANPDRPQAIPREGAATPQVYGQALCQLLERYPTKKLPQHAGLNATVIVTMTLETLEGRLGAGGILDTGHRLSPGEVRRLACRAGVIPVVLNGRSQVVDVAVKGRYHTEPQRLAQLVEQGGLCNIEQCDRPGVHAHHREAWSKGGETSKQNCEMLCERHHTLVHQRFHYPRRT